MLEYIELFLTFAKIGVMTFGGGYAMLPMFQRELVERKNWVTEEDLMDYFAIGQCTPGVIAVNTATFVGQKLKGIRGGLAATFGVVFPSVVIITVLAEVIVNAADSVWVQYAFAGVRVCVCVQIFNAVVRLAKKALVDRWTAGIFIAVMILSMLTDISPTWFVLVSGALGVVLHVLGLRKEEKS